MRSVIPSRPEGTRPGPPIVERPDPRDAGRGGRVVNTRDRDRRDYDRNRYDRDRRGAWDRSHYDPMWYSSWRYDRGPRWYPGHPGVWIELVYVRSPERWSYGARAVRCSIVGDELENAHDEWHWRNDRYQWEWWYPDEHARLMRALDLEWARSGCGRRPVYDIDCRYRGAHHPRTSEAVIVALEVLDILMDGHVHH